MAGQARARGVGESRPAGVSRRRLVIQPGVAVPGLGVADPGDLARHLHLSAEQADRRLRPGQRGDQLAQPSIGLLWRAPGAAVEQLGIGEFDSLHQTSTSTQRPWRGGSSVSPGRASTAATSPVGPSTCASSEGSRADVGAALHAGASAHPADGGDPGSPRFPGRGCTGVTGATSGRGLTASCWAVTGITPDGMGGSIVDSSCSSPLAQRAGPRPLH